MKDYTKYDFAAIVGAEVRINFKDGGDYKGTLVSDAPELTAICVRHHLGFVRKICKENILYLTAKIKVEDMSVKQMMEFCFHKGNCNYVVLYNDKTCVSTCGKHAKNIELTDYIDCTDWGWNHE